MKTIKQIANELGVPKYKVEYQVRKIPQHKRMIFDGILHLDELQVANIKGLLVQNLPQNYTADIPQFLRTFENLATQQAKTNELLSELIQQNNKLLEASADIPQQSATAAESAIAEKVRQQKISQAQRKKLKQKDWIIYILIGILILGSFFVVYLLN